MKFLHVTDHVHEGLFADDVMIGGFYQNHIAFQKFPQSSGEFGYVRTYSGKLKNFDIIYVCMAKPEVDGFIVNRIREEVGYGPDAPIVVGAIDYALEIWDMPFQPLGVRDQLSKCDVIMTSEPGLQNAIKALMLDRKVHLCPHATNVEYLKRFRKPRSERQFNIVTMVHRYDNNWKAPFISLMKVMQDKRLGKEMPDMEAILLSGDKDAQIQLLPFFTKVQFGAPYPVQMEYLSRQLICLDSYHRIHTYGRTVVDCAAVGLPLVGTKLQYLQEILFPGLTTAPYDLYAQQQLIDQLINDKAWYDHIVSFAFDKCDEFSWHNSVKRFMKCIVAESETTANKVERMGYHD